MFTWESESPPPDLRPRGLGWLRLGLRGAAMLIVIAVGLSMLLVLRMIERPLFGRARPMTPHITVWVCRSCLVILGLPVTARGAVLRQPGAMVCNHVSWLDIFVLNSRAPLYFVAKHEVATWPGIGWLARATGTVFIRRNPREARAHADMLEQRMLAGHQLLFFPEGTSTDGRRVLPFRTTLFAAFFSDQLRHVTYVQPVSLVYHAPVREDSRFYGWWGDMAFGANLLAILAAGRQGRVEVIYHPAERVDGFPNRKTLARFAETQVRGGHQLIDAS